jgi:hypothetical protein
MTRIRLTESALRRIVREALLQEIDIEEVGEICYTHGSTHVMNTCKIGGEKYFLKFSDADLFDDHDPSLQVLIEYLAYRIYSLYSGVRIPRIELVYDKRGSRVGLASSPASGKQIFTHMVKDLDAIKSIAKSMSSGVYVDVFLANWDVVASGNFFVDQETGGATRIDPGGSMTFRAQGGRKGRNFNAQAGELDTMLKRGFGAGEVYTYADLEMAAREFEKVSWPQIESIIRRTEEEVAGELSGFNNELLSQWTDDIEHIINTLKLRHKIVMDHINFVREHRG